MNAGALREWYRSIKEPKHVEKASKSERRKRKAWQATSIVVSFGSVLVAGLTISALVDWFPPTGYVGLAVAVGMILLAGIVDARYVFPWGVERFDIVVPWQFRDAEVEE